MLRRFPRLYELRPGTVFYAVYGSLYRSATIERRWSNEGNYLTTRRGLFLKASYLYRF